MEGTAGCWQGTGNTSLRPEAPPGHSQAFPEREGNRLLLDEDKLVLHLASPLLVCPGQDTSMGVGDKEGLSSLGLSG